MRRISVILLLTCALLPAEEGMWTFNNFPSDKVKATYGFSPDREWLDKVRLSSVRLTEGCSASFVSSEGLVLTNHHCASTCIQQISSARKDYAANGFYAQTEGEEARCPEQEANVLIGITDVTAQLAAATRGMPDKAANDARKAEIAKIEKACATSERLRCEVVSLYGGGVYDLYKYQRYQDVRLVFAPEFAIAFFGGDPDNFMFPRYDLDLTFLRIYENGKPLRTKHYFPVSRGGPKAEELVFVSGNPGSTNRQDTISMLETQRDVITFRKLLYLAEYRGLLTEFQTRGEEEKRISQDELFTVENSLKAYTGEEEALLDERFFAQKRGEEREFRKRVESDPALRRKYGKAWDEIARVEGKHRQLWPAYQFVEILYGFRSDLYRHARRLVRMAEEYSKPNGERLAEYADARKPEVTQALLSAAPIYPEFETETLTWSLTKLREVLGPDDPFIRKLFGKRSPREVATEAVQGTALRDVAARKKLMEGGKAALAASHDPMIALAELVDPHAREIRKKMEDEVESALTISEESLAKARFAVYGKSIYPDATFTPRLTYGQVKGWEEKGRAVPPFTNLGGAFERATGRFPFALPESWLRAKTKLNLQTPFNFVTTNDIIGGNSGSPVIDRNAELVGLIFDGNIHSLGGDYGFDAALNRAVAVDSAAILEALDKVYGAGRVLGELRRQ
ncbi:MAG: S46 family peptidase [Bryobacterales bacterium]|nr:S46 family peptidase [Bryobacterales bacterium]